MFAKEAKHMNLTAIGAYIALMRRVRGLT